MVKEKLSVNAYKCQPLLVNSLDMENFFLWIKFCSLFFTDGDEIVSLTLPALHSPERCFV
jgi:hypothetical protein